MEGFDQNVPGTEVDYSVLVKQVEQVLEGLKALDYSLEDHGITEDTGEQIDHYHRPRDFEQPRGYETINQDTERFNEVWTKIGYNPEEEIFETRVVALEDGFYGVALGDDNGIGWYNLVDEPTYHRFKRSDGFQTVLGYSDGSFNGEPVIDDVVITNKEPVSEEVEMNQWTDAYPVFNRDSVRVQRELMTGKEVFGIKIDPELEQPERLTELVQNAHQTLQNIDSLQQFQEKTKRNF